MKKEFERMNVNTLVDLLAHEMQKFTQLTNEREYESCRNKIICIQEEIERRKNYYPGTNSPENNFSSQTF